MFKIKKYIPDIVVAIILIAGIGLLAYPTIGDYINALHSSKAIGKFTDLKDGIYLVVQTGSSGKAKDFTNVQPFLVIIPQFENGIQNRVVNAKPKTEIQRKEKPEIPPQTPPDLSPKKRPQTGDITNMFRWNGVLMLKKKDIIRLCRRQSGIIQIVLTA